VTVAFQQVQKVGNGANRISANRLFEMAIALGVPLSAFFDGLPAASRAASLGLAGDAPNDAGDDV
jgi:transcriptional regulator with XRE-family HTH domain